MDTRSKMMITRFDAGNGTKLLVPNSSPVRSYRDLAGKTAVVTAGTTNEAALRTLSDKQKLNISIVTAPDHAQSLETLAAGRAEAFATDDGRVRKGERGTARLARSDHDDEEPMTIAERIKAAQLALPFGMILRPDQELKQRNYRSTKPPRQSAGVSALLCTGIEKFV